MAVVVRIRIDGAGQDDHDRLQEAVGRRLDELGGPPEGLMVHLAHPDADGLVVVEAWRAEAPFRAFVQEVLEPALAEAGLVAQAPDVAPAWSIARP